MAQFSRALCMNVSTKTASQEHYNNVTQTPWKILVCYLLVKLFSNDFMMPFCFDSCYCKVVYQGKISRQVAKAPTNILPKKFMIIKPERILSTTQARFILDVLQISSYEISYPDSEKHRTDSLHTNVHNPTGREIRSNSFKKVLKTKKVQYWMDVNKSNSN